MKFILCQDAFTIGKALNTTERRIVKFIKLLTAFNLFEREYKTKLEIELISLWGIRIKTLLPSLKENKRYILYDVEFVDKMDDSRGLIEEKLRNFVGDLGIARAGLRFVDAQHNRGIIQVSHTSVHEIKTGLALINGFNVRTIKVSGSLSKLLNEWQKRR